MIVRGINSYHDASRIHRPALTVTVITLFVIALIFVLGRTVIRFRIQKRLSLDDAFFYFGVICLCAALGLLMQFSETMYMNEAFRTTGLSAAKTNWRSLMLQFNKTSDAYLALTYTTLFSVKLSFLWFFRILVRHDPKMVIYWWTVFAIMIVAWPVSIVAAVAPSCPVFGIPSVSCIHRFGYPRVVGLAALATILDIASDILLLIIPFHLLWRIQIKLRQKLVLGTTLCLSIFMIIIAIVRISKICLGTYEAEDIVWVIFWQQVEACTAVIMVSLSSFRSLFVTHESRLREDRIRNRHWYMSKKMACARRQNMFLQSESEEVTDRLPRIPRATMTGMSTFIRGGPRNESRISSLGAGDFFTLSAESENVERIRG